MTLELINPDELPTPESYTQVVAASGSRLVFVSGQVADDAQGNLVGPGDLAAQARQAFANVGRALVAAGAGPNQVSRITIYVVHTDLSTCLSSRRPGLRYSATTCPPTPL
jgi:enamine deaminase RidA (YjgF/YER057c/UK114 family)